MYENEIIENRQSINSNNSKSDAVTIFANTPSKIFSQFYKSGLASKGYYIIGKIIPHKAQFIGDDGNDVELFTNDQKLYAATFVRNI